MNSFDILRNNVDHLNNDGTTILTVKSRAGLGKTFTVLSKLKEKKLEVEKDFLYLSGYITPLDLYQNLMNHADKLVVIDDVEGMLKEKKNLAMLKAATYPTLKGERVVQYRSTHREEEESAFISNSKFIILCNEVPKAADFKAVISRGIYYDFKPSNDEVFEQLLMGKDVDMGIVEFMRLKLKHHFPANFRQYWQCLSIKKAYPEQWKEMSLPILQVKDKYSFMRSLLGSGLTVKKQLEKYVANGQSRATYFRHKSTVCDEVSKNSVSKEVNQ